MDLRLRETTWVKLLTLLLWTVLVMLRKLITLLIEVAEKRVFSVDDRSARGESRGKQIENPTLLPPLSDELVLTRIWPLLHRRVNVSLLWRLRRVNRAWKRSVGVSLHWAALEIVRVDTPGLTRYLTEQGERRPSLRERVEGEMKSVTVLLAEDLASYSAGSNWSAVSWRPDEDYWSESQGDESGGHSCTYKRNLLVYPDELWDESSEESFRYMAREFDASTSSSEGSLRVYYPRHVVRGECL